MIDPNLLAQKALAEVAKGTLENYFYNVDLSSSIYESILNKDIDDQAKLIKTALEKGLSLDFFYGSIAPMIAEKLGDAWKEDTLSFAEVTIALGKLRLLCQKFEERYFSSTEESFGGPNVLMVTAEEDNHTFGAYIASVRLRKSNMNARLVVGSDQSEVLDFLRKGSFELVGISVGSEKTIKSANKLIKAIKENHKIPVIAGGSYVAHNMEEAKKLLDADGFEFEPEDINSYLNSRKNTN
jgi:methanogenic corrinoid protein MtbC1